MTATVSAVVTLEAALRAVGDALASAELDRLLETEPILVAALEGLPSEVPADPEARAHLRQAITGTRQALLRCKRLGTAMADVTRSSLHGISGEYSREGMSRPVQTSGSLEARG